MKKTETRFTAGILLAGVLLLHLGTASADEPLVRQSFNLRPGWNAIFLEVEPENPALAAVFKDMPIAGVWTWQPRNSTVRFLRDPGENLLRQEGWHAYFPPSRGEQAALSNLFALGANRPYLVEVTGTEPVTLTVRGRPSLKRLPWVADSFNFTGFVVDPETPPTFGAFFAPSGAHKGQAIYRLGQDGAWHLVEQPAQTPMNSGEAFWIFTSGASAYAGPLSVALDYGDELDFGATLPERSLQLINATDTTKHVMIRQVSSGNNIPLRQFKVGESGVSLWPELQGEPAVRILPRQEEMVRLSLKRTELPSGESGAVLELTDGQGFLLRLPVMASVEYSPLGAEPDHAGLWVGTVRINAVTEAQIPAKPEFTIPQPTGSEFIFKIIIHVNSLGQAALLKEVIQMRGTSSYVLLTNDALVPGYEPITLVGGEPFSHRISTAAYDFDGLQLNLGGSFSMSGTLSGSINLASNQSTNPFKHAFHPDHNNLDELGYPIGNAALMEAYQVTRAVEMAFSQDSPECLGLSGCVNPPDWGFTRMGGIYRETLTGLHRNPIKVSGTFLLKRVTDIPVLNQEVGP